MSAFSEGFHDPQLWRRLEPKLREVLAKCEQDILQQRVKDFESYSNAMGFVRGLRTVFEIAQELEREGE